MAKNTKKRQKTLAKKAAKRKAKRKSAKSSGLFTRMPSINKAGEWPLFECLIAAEWRDTKKIAQIVVARQADTGHIAVGAFLVDLACLGVKNALTRVFPSPGEYRREYLNGLMERQPMTECDLDLAAKVIEEATKYAKSLGFKPHKDVRKALKVMGKAHPENSSETIPLGGDEGKPFFIAGPYDNTNRIIQILDRNVGPGNYHYLVPMDDPSLMGDFEIIEE